MNESELVDGAEYEGLRDHTQPESVVRGVFRAGMYVSKDIVVIGKHSVWRDTLRRVSPAAAPAIAEKDRLHVGERVCWACGKHGAPSWKTFHGFSHNQEENSFLCTYPAHKNELWWGHATQEYDRRKQLASGSVTDDRCPTICPDGRRCDLKRGHGETHQTSIRLPSAAVKQAEPERPTAEDRCACGAIATRPDPHMGGDCPMEFCQECFEKEEKRLHYLERCAAYAFSNARDGADGCALGDHGAPSRLTLERQGKKLDAAIARTKKPDEPAYINHNWPPADENDP